MKNRRLITVQVAVVVALAATGVSYAHWTQTLQIQGTVSTGELDWEFEGWFFQLDAGLDWTCNSTCDDRPSISNIHQSDSDMASTTGEFKDTDGDGDYDTFEVTVQNAYPSYYNCITFPVRNNGKIPLKIWKVIINKHEEFLSLPAIVCLDLNNDEENDIIITYWDKFGEQLEYGDSATLSFGFHILQGAPQEKTLSFTIELVCIQWNMYTP